MKTVIKVLTQKKPESSHHETEITVDWAGVSEADLRLMAQCYLVQRVQFRMKLNDCAIPEKVSVDAKDFVHHLPEAQWESRPRKQAAEKKSAWDTIIDSLTPAEKKAIIQQLGLVT